MSVETSQRCVSEKLATADQIGRPQATMALALLPTPSAVAHPPPGRPLYGQPTPPVYGLPTPAVYGQPTPPVYGQPTPAPSSVNPAPLPYGYAAPLPYQQSPQPSVQMQRTDIASPSSRLLARTIDNVVFWGPFVLAGLALDHPSATVRLLLVSACAVFFLGLAAGQAYLISTTGQSLGKKALRIRIENSGGGNPGFGRGWVLRSFLFTLIEIPVSGLLLYLPSLVDSMMVFTANGRTIHDLIAGTVVVKANGPPSP